MRSRTRTSRPTRRSSRSRSSPASARAAPTSATSTALLPFVQFEHPGRLGLADGRYVVRDEDRVERVLVVQTFGAPHPSRRKQSRSRRAKKVASPELPEVPITRCTVADSKELGDARAANAWLKATGADPKKRAALAGEALAVLNRGLEALREAAEDPLVAEATFHHALAVRIGFGTGVQIADGQWTEARELPPTPSARHQDLEAQRRAALKLAGTDPDEIEDDD